MKKILLIDGIYPINTRSLRIIRTLSEENDIKFCAWNRNDILVSDNFNYIYSSNEGYGNKVKKILGMYKYYKYLKSKNLEFNPELIIASQWDMLLLAVLLKSKKQKLIYDNIDMPTSEFNLVIKLLRFLEAGLLKKTDGIIYASRFFKKCYNLKISNIILENKPLKELVTKEKIEYKSKKIKISFMGTIRYYEVFEKVFEVLENYQDKVEFLFFGTGHAEDKLKELVKIKNIKNIKFFGKYNYDEIGKFYNSSDLVWAVYPAEDYNVKYAISNKFHESILFEKPCLFSKDTLLGEFIQKENIGISLRIEELEIVIKELCDGKIDLDILKENIKNYKLKNSKIYWEDEEKQLGILIRGLK